MKILESYLGGSWQGGKPATEADWSILYNPTTEEPLAKTSSQGLDLGRALEHARQEGGAALREMSLGARAKMLGEVANAIHAHREELLDLATENGGNTRGDGKFDIDGATSTLSAYAKLGEDLGEQTLLPDGEATPLGRSPRLVGRHVLAPRHGVAVLINAFNFPAWGFAEKAAAAWLAGMPVLCKPATATALVAHRIAEILVESRLLPPGALSFLFGGASDLLEHLNWQDVLAFTGSSQTGLAIRGTPSVLARGVRVNVEADSLNAAVMAPDVEPGEDTYELMLQEILRDMTQKAGQKCTAIRRIMVPAEHLTSVRDDLVGLLEGVRVGDPKLREVKVGPLATAAQLASVQSELDRFCAEATIVTGGAARGDLLGVPGDVGYFMRPTLLVAKEAGRGEALHAREAFGPVATLIPYDGTVEQAAQLIVRGQGSLVSSLYSDDEAFARAFVRGTAHALGRVHLGSRKIAEHSLGPGTVLPLFMHGGPGRAGGGAELGGLRALELYMQRSAVQGFAPWLDTIT